MCCRAHRPCHHWSKYVYWLSCTYRNACVRFFISVIGVLRNGLGDPYGDSLSDSATNALASAKSSSFIVSARLFYRLMQQQNEMKKPQLVFLSFICEKSTLHFDTKYVSRWCRIRNCIHFRFGWAIAILSKQNCCQTVALTPNGKTSIKIKLNLVFGAKFFFTISTHKMWIPIKTKMRIGFDVNIFSIISI